jgi:hypothetical protein
MQKTNEELHDEWYKKELSEHSGAERVQIIHKGLNMPVQTAEHCEWVMQAQHRKENPAVIVEYLKKITNGDKSKLDTFNLSYVFYDIAFGKSGDYEDFSKLVKKAENIGVFTYQ